MVVGVMGDSVNATYTHDEIADLTGAVNSMSANLKDIVEQISASAGHLGASSEQLSIITEQTSQSIYEQQSQTEQVATAMNEMSTTVQEVSRNITGTAQAANEAHLETASGTKIVEASINSIKQLADQLEGAASVIQQLEQDSEDINTVLDVIKSIAEQTNLLALNAAIEAARAGEQGRGFAVVADEVRTLAGRTQESTAEINQVIEKLQTGSRRAVEVMTRSREDARAVVEQAAKAGNSLSAISISVGRINDMSTQIASAAEQQSATAEEINRNIVSISAIANRTADGARETVTSTEDMAELGLKFQGLVSRFSV